MTPEWPLWKIELVEEMLHEYQYKIVEKPTEEGCKLYEIYKLILSSEKDHDEKFTTAICTHANYFKMTPQQLLEKLFSIVIGKSDNMILRIISKSQKKRI